MTTLQEPTPAAATTATAKTATRRFTATGRPITRPATRTTEAERLMQQGLGLAGAFLMPLGLIAIGLGWYGAAHTPYSFEQVSYVISGGLLGLALTTLGGFLFFGSWLARIAHQQRQQTELLVGELARLTAAILETREGE